MDGTVYGSCRPHPRQQPEGRRLREGEGRTDHRSPDDEWSPILGGCQFYRGVGSTSRVSSAARSRYPLGWTTAAAPPRQGIDAAARVGTCPFITISDGIDAACGCHLRAVRAASRRARYDHGPRPPASHGHRRPAPPLCSHRRHPRLAPRNRSSTARAPWRGGRTRPDGSAASRVPRRRACRRHRPAIGPYYGPTGRTVRTPRPARGRCAATTTAPKHPRAREPESPRAREPESPRAREPESPRAREPESPRAAAGRSGARHRKGTARGPDTPTRRGHAGAGGAKVAGPAAERPRPSLRLLPPQPQALGGVAGPAAERPGRHQLLSSLARAASS
jgi:hypothetical protein